MAKDDKNINNLVQQMTFAVTSPSKNKIVRSKPQVVLPVLDQQSIHSSGPIL